MTGVALPAMIVVNASCRFRLALREGFDVSFQKGSLRLAAKLPSGLYLWKPLNGNDSIKHYLGPALFDGGRFGVLDDEWAPLSFSHNANSCCARSIDPSLRRICASL